MIATEVEVVAITWNEALAVRHKVLWPQKAMSFCKVAGDEAALHFGIKDGEKLVCVASIYIDDESARLRKFATLNDYQCRGLGSVMLNHILTELAVLNLKYFWFDARESAVAFYNKFGFDVTGQRFFKSDVAYYKMSKALS